MQTEVLMGANSLDYIVAKHKKIFVITDEMMAKNGMISYVTKRLDIAKIPYEIYSEIKADPDVEMLIAGVSRLAKFSPDAVIAFGGGSPIDAAKAIVFFAKNHFNMRNCKFVAIPTTSGTGTEVSRFAVITDAKKGVKYPMVDDSLLPDFAVLDARLTLSVPANITADTGLDVLTHAIEAYVSRSANPISDAMAEKAVSLVHKNLLLVYKNPQNLEAREQMHCASCMAGMAFSGAGLGLNHAMAHALGAKLHLPHGRANAILLPYVIAHNAGINSNKMHKIADKYASLAKLMGDTSSSTRQSVLGLIRIIQRLERELNIKSIDLSRSEYEKILPELAETALQDKCLQTSPVKASHDDIIAIYQKVYSG